MGSLWTYQTIVVCLYLMALLQIHAMDIEKPKEDSSSDTSYPRYRFAPNQGSLVVRGGKNTTDGIAEIEHSDTKQLKSVEKSVMRFKANISDSETVLQPPPISKKVRLGKERRPSNRAKAAAADSNSDCEHSGNCPQGRTSLVLTTSGSVTKSPKSRQSTRPYRSDGTAVSPAPTLGLRVGALLDRDPLMRKPTPRTRLAGVGLGHKPLSRDDGLPPDIAKESKQKPRPPKEEKPVNETSGRTPDAQKQPEEPDPSDGIEGRDKHAGGMEPPNFPPKPIPTKPSERIKKPPKVFPEVHSPTLRPPRVPVVTTPMVRSVTKQPENPVVSKGESKPEQTVSKEDNDRGVVEIPGEDKDQNYVAPGDFKPGGKDDVVIVPSEKYPLTKAPPTPPTTPRKETPPQPTPPEFHVTVKLTMSWREFCIRTAEFKSIVTVVFQESTRSKLSEEQVVIMYEKEHCGPRKRYIRQIEILVDFFITDQRGVYSKKLTEMCFKAFKDGTDILRKSFDYKILEFSLSGSKESYSTTQRKGTTIGTGIIVAIVIAAIAGLCLLLLLLLQLIYRRRNQGKAMRPYVGDSYPGHAGYPANNTLDSIAMAAMTSPNRYSVGGFMNPGLDASVDRRLSIIPPSNAVLFPGLSSFNLDMETLEAEFMQLPNNMPRLSEVPKGAEHKNRYANVIPIPATRVILKPKPGMTASEYINANFVKGHKDRSHAYIATQAPVKATVEDFWRMVWEQQTKVIVMLTGLEEKGISKCEEYFPRSDGVDNTLMFGDYMVVLKLQDVRQDYVLSGLTLKDVERNLCREVVHFWFTGWPTQGVPESPRNVVHFLLHVHAYQSKSKAPEIVHCSPGTGRTGTIIAINTCMKAFEDNGTADVLNTVYRLRQDRAGAVQTKEQYAFIYKAINEYALMLSSPTLCPEENGLPSRRSKVGTSQDDMMQKY